MSAIDAFRAIFHGDSSRVANLVQVPGAGWTANATLAKDSGGFTRIVTAAHNVGNEGCVVWRDGTLAKVPFYRVGPDTAISPPIKVRTNLKMGALSGSTSNDSKLVINHRKGGNSFEPTELPVVDLGVKFPVDLGGGRKGNFEVMETENNPAIRVGASGAPLISKDGRLKGVFRGPMDDNYPELHLPPIEPGRRRILIDTSIGEW